MTDWYGEMRVVGEIGTLTYYYILIFISNEKEPIMEIEVRRVMK